MPKPRARPEFDGVNLSSLADVLLYLAERGYLSGSWARGDARRDSDVDVRLAERYVKPLAAALMAQGVKWESAFLGSLTWWPDGMQVEVSYLYPRYKRGPVVLNGVEFRT